MAQQEGQARQIEPENPAPFRLVTWTRYGRWTVDGSSVLNNRGEVIYRASPAPEPTFGQQLEPQNPDVASSRFSDFALGAEVSTLQRTAPQPDSGASFTLRIPVLR